jgi:cobalt/nickel transport system permease protein
MINIIGWRRLEDILSMMRIPRLIVDILGMTYRYIFLLIYASYEMLLSVKSRLNFRVGYKESMDIGSKILGSLFIKTYKKSELLYLSMLSRGYSVSHSNPRNFGNRVSYKNLTPYLLLFTTLYVIVYLLEGVIFG